MANHSFCENCGTPCPLGDTLCAACARQVQTEFHRPDPRYQKRSGGGKVLIPVLLGVLAIVIATVAIIMIFKVFHKDDSGALSDETTTQQTQDPTGDTEPDTTPPVEEQEEPEEEQPIETMTACVECGASIPESAQFCSHCGKSQTEPEEEEEEEAEPEPITMERIDSSDANPNSWGKVDVSGAYGTSVVSQSGNHDNTAGVTLDGDLDTSWQEGVDGSGIGEGIVYNLDGDYAVQYISFNLGNWRTTDWYAQNNVPQALDIVINEEIYRVNFPYGQSKYWVALSEPVVTDCVEIYIAAAYPGSVYNDTCIAEVGIYGEPA